MTPASARERLTRPVLTAAVLGVLAALAIGGLHFYRAGQPCGAGVGHPEDAVSGVLTAIQDGDSRSLCRRLESSYTIPVQQIEVLRQRMRAAGGAEDLEVTELKGQQMGAEHVLSVTSRGEVIAQFQTIGGEHGAVVVAVTTSPGSGESVWATGRCGGPWPTPDWHDRF